jgi:hypothetical protein
MGRGAALATLLAAAAACRPAAEDPPAPIEAAFLETWSEVALQAAGPTVLVEKRALVCVPGFGIVAVDLRDPALPEAADPEGGAACVDLATAAGWLYLLDTGALSVRHPSTWAIQGELALPEGVEPSAMSFDAGEGTAWVGGATDTGGWIGAVATQAPSQMRLVADVAVDGAVVALTQDSEGVYAMLADGSLVLLDLDGALQATWPAGATPEGRALAVADHHLYVARGAAGLEVLDVSRPAAPGALPAVALDGAAATALFASGDRLYAGAPGALHVLDTRDAAAPTRVGVATLDGDALPIDVPVGGGLGVVADGSQDRLLVVNVS